jgi:hypothetical protein
VRPWVGGSAGLAGVDAIAISECCDFAGANSRLYAASRAPLVAALAGVDLNVTGRVAIGVESAFQWQGGLTPDLADLRDGPFVSEETFPGRRWSIPVTGVLRVRF